MAMQQFVITLSGGEAIDPDRVGPKTANLAALARAGLPTPGGFCLVSARSRNDSGVVSLTEAFKEIAPSLPAHLADALALRLFRHAERWLQRGAKELWLDPQPVDPVIRDVPRLENQPERVRAGLQAPAWPQGSFA
jgi:hypothetical protein